MRAKILPHASIQYDGQGGQGALSTASEVFLIFTIQLYSCNNNAIFPYID